MAQFQCYIPDEIAERFRNKAQQAHLSTSKYLARLVKREVDNQWPKDYFELFGSWEGEALERPAQGEFEERAELK